MCFGIRIPHQPLETSAIVSFTTFHYPHQHTVDTPVCLPPRRRSQPSSLKSWHYTVHQPLTFLAFQLFPQVNPVMIKPLREAYENYERTRLEEETVAAAAAQPPESDSEPNKVLESSRTNATQGHSSSKRVMGVSKEIRDIFHDKSTESRLAQ